MSCYEVLTCSVSIMALLLSLYTFLKNRDLNKAVIEQNIAARISKASSQLQEAASDVAAFIGSTEPLAEEMRSKHSEAIYDYLKSYDEACSKYYSGSVRKRVFLDLHSNEILNLDNDGRFADCLSKDKFIYLSRFIKENK